MSIEDNLDRIATALETIAVKLEVFQTKDGEVETPSEETAAAKKKRIAAEKRAEKKELPTKEDARTALGEVQEAADPDAARTILAEFDATSMKKLKVEDYPKVIAACEAFLSNLGSSEGDGGILDD